jgi:hypothetical protein
MSRRDDLIAAIQQTLGPAFAPPIATPPGVSGRSARSRDAHLYEQYIFTLILKAAEKELADISYWDVFGNRVASATVFRESPGRIYSTARPFTHALLNFENMPPLEVHVCVQVAGTSEVVHECDVVVLMQEEAETCRQRRVIPRASKVILGVECKSHGTELPLREGRGFLGLTMEFPGRDFYFVTDISSPSVAKLLAKKDRRWEHNVFPVPMSPSPSLEVELLRSAFQKTFRNFMAESA